MATYHFNKTGKTRKLSWRKSRTRGVQDAVRIIGNIIKDIEDLIKDKKKVTILEVGCGYGRALLDIKKIFKDKVTIHGINIGSRWNTNLIRRFAIRQRMFSKKEADKNIPRIHILDAGKKMPFKDGTFDFIFSQFCVQYIKDKSLFLEEVNRILKTDGMARIHLQPPFKSIYPPEYRELFEIWQNNRRVKFKEYMQRFKNINVYGRKHGRANNIIIKKARKFKLNLKFVTYIDLNQIFDNWQGVKSIYAVNQPARKRMSLYYYSK